MASRARPRTILKVPLHQRDGVRFGPEKARARAMSPVTPRDRRVLSHGGARGIGRSRPSYTTLRRRGRATWRPQPTIDWNLWSQVDLHRLVRGVFQRTFRRLSAPQPSPSATRSAAPLNPRSNSCGKPLAALAVRRQLDVRRPFQAGKTAASTSSGVKRTLHVGCGASLPSGELLKRATNRERSATLTTFDLSDVFASV